MREKPTAIVEPGSQDGTDTGPIGPDPMDPVCTVTGLCSHSRDTFPWLDMVEKPLSHKESRPRNFTISG